MRDKINYEIIHLRNQGSSNSKSTNKSIFKNNLLMT